MLVVSELPAAAATWQSWHTTAYGGNSMCLDVPGGDQRDGVRIIQWWCHGGGNQLWTVESETVWPAHTIHRVKNAATNKCLDVPWGNAYNGAPIQQWGCHWGIEQRWERV